MGQIVQNFNNPVRCNLSAIRSGGSKASYVLDSGEVWLVDTTNSPKGTSGYGLYNAFIIGDGTTAASSLTLQSLDGYVLPSGGIPSNDLHSSVQALLAKADTAYQKSTNGIPLTDLAGSVQASLGKADTAIQAEDIVNKADKATTLAGYGIVDGYTKTEGQTLENTVEATLTTQNAAIATLNGNNVVLTTAHASESSPNTNTIYREPNDSTDPTAYTDWMYDGTSWVKLSTYTLSGMDSVPTRDSNKLITSGAVYDVVNPIAGSSDEIINISVLQTYLGVMGTNDSAYSGGDGTKYQHKYIPVYAGDKFVINNTSQGITVYGFVKSTGVTGNAYDMATGSIRTGLYANTTSSELVAPEDAIYLCINTLYNGENRTPIVTKKAVPGKIAQIESDISGLENAIDGCVQLAPTSYTRTQKNQVLENIGIENPEELIDLLKSGGGNTSLVELNVNSRSNEYFISSSGVITSTPGHYYEVRFYDLTGVSLVKIVGSSHLATDGPRAYAFYNGNTTSATNVGQVGPVLTDQYEYTLDVPTGASYLACSFNTSPNNDGGISLNVYSLESGGNTKLHALMQDIEDLKSNSSGYGLYRLTDPNNNEINYYHFTIKNGVCLIRLFKLVGPNNILDLYSIHTGSVSSTGVVIQSTIQIAASDNIGPISIFNTDLWPGKYGAFAGGWHTVTVEGINYPTAEQVSLEVKVNGETITTDGLYYGEVHIKAVNDIYFPQSITNGLSSGTKALTETREIILNDVMNVKVKMKVITPVRISAYHGILAMTTGFENITLLNNGKEFTIASLNDSYYPNKPERKFYMSSGNRHYDLTLLDTGLGMFTTSSERYGMFVPGRNKAYFYVIDGTTNAPTIAANTIFGWEGIYDIYFD